MILEFLGAAHEVTGSCHYLEFGGKHVLVDCGMEQGPDLYVNQETRSMRLLLIMYLSRMHILTIPVCCHCYIITDSAGRFLPR